MEQIVIGVLCVVGFAVFALILAALYYRWESPVQCEGRETYLCGACNRRVVTRQWQRHTCSGRVQS